MVGILWEAFCDFALSTPVWKKGDTYLTREGAQPTASKLHYAKDEPVVDPGKPGIDENKLKVMRYLSGLAGEQSKILSGMVFKLFGKLNIGFVIGGGLSFGDNDTLAEVLDTTFEVCAKRVTLEMSRRLFMRVTYGAGAQALDAKADPAGARALELIDDLGLKTGK